MVCPGQNRGNERLERHCRNCSAQLGLEKVVSDLLSDGYRVKLDGLGALKVAVSTLPAATEKDFDVAKNVKNTRILFQPETEKAGSHGARNRVLANKLEFKKVASMVEKKEKKKKGGTP